jgi:RNA polymerase sigma-70 factor (ECF subfamily)
VDEAALLGRVSRGDEAAFSQLYTRHQRSVYLFASRMCGADAGDDIVQETFLVLLRHSGRYDQARGSVAAYLLGIARHLVLRRLGAKYKAGAVEDVNDAVDCVSPGESVLDSLTRAETIDAVRAAVLTLPPVYREVVILCELQEMDYATAAEVIQCPIGTVRSRLHRARALLTGKLAAQRPLAFASKGVR